MLGGLALKWRWRKERLAAGLPADRPNLVMGANVQVCWEKFCRYFDVEAHLVPVGPDVAHLTAGPAVAHCDENTIGVVAILGSTYYGAYEPVEEISRPSTTSPATAPTSRSTWTEQAAPWWRRSSTRSSCGTSVSRG